MSSVTNSVEIYDSTLRDGAQALGISFSVEDKMLICVQYGDGGGHVLASVH